MRDGVTSDRLATSGVRPDVAVTCPPMMRRVAMWAVIVLVTAAMGALMTLGAATALLRFRLERAWWTPAVAISSSDGDFDVRLAASQALALPAELLRERDEGLRRLTADGTPHAWPDPGEVATTPLAVDWYRSVFDARTSDGYEVQLIAGSNLFPFELDPVWFAATPSALRAWLHAPHGVLVHEDLLRERGWHVGQRVAVASSAGELDFDVVGTYRGAMPRLLVVHWGQLAAEGRGGNAASVLVLPAHADRVDALVAAARQRLAGAGHPWQVASLSERLEPVLFAPPTVRWIHFFLPAVALSLLAALVAVWRTSALDSGAWLALVVGCALGAAIMVWRGAHGIDCGAWAYRYVKLGWMDGAVGFVFAAAACGTGVLLFADGRGARLLVLAVPIAAGGLSVSASLLAEVDRYLDPPPLTGAERVSLFLPSEVVEAHGMVLAGLGTSPAVVPRERGWYVDGLGATALPIAGRFEVYPVRSLQRGGISAHPEVSCRGGDSSTAPSGDSVWVGTRLLQRMGKHLGEAIDVMGARFVIRGELFAPGWSIESELWISDDRMLELAGPPFRQVSFLVQPGKTDRFVADARAAQPDWSERWVTETQRKAARTRAHAASWPGAWASVLGGACASALSLAMILVLWLDSKRRIHDLGVLLVAVGGGAAAACFIGAACSVYYVIINTVLLRAGLPWLGWLAVAVALVGAMLLRREKPGH